MMDYDILILVVYDMFEGTVFYLVSTKDNLDSNDQANLKETKGVLNTEVMSIGFNRALEDLDSLLEFPYEEFKAASNPKVLTLIID